MMCAWLLLSAASRGRRHLSSLWEESTWGGGLGRWEVGGLTTDWLSPFILSNNLLLRPHKEGLPREGEPVLPMCWLQEDDCLLCFQGEATRRPQCVASRFSGPVAIPPSETTAAVLSGTGQTRMKMRFVFFFPLFLLSSLISAASRENYTLLKDAVIFLATCQLKWFLKKLFPSTSAQHSEYRRSCRFPYFHR